MEDEDVESVNEYSAPVETSRADHVVSSESINIPCENKDRSFTEDEIDVKEEDRTSNIDRLKSAVTHSVNRFSENVDDTGDLTSPSPKKINGEVGKSESLVSSEESSDSDKGEDDAETVKNKSDLEEENVHSKDLNKRKRSSDHSYLSNDSENEADDGRSSDSSPVEFRGFKKRKILESGAENLLDNNEEASKEEKAIDNDINESEKPKSVELRRSMRNAKRYNSNEIISIEEKEESGDQLTEYAQYLGLQPTVKFKCGRCGEKHFQSMASLNAHQMVCCKTATNTLAKQPKPSCDSNLSTNFRITRKVYLCSACGTYYENWKLFLHMRDMHKRHICLFCLGMFSVAERLAEHLLFQHNVHEKTCKSPEEFLNLFKGSCYLTCCSCEKMFTERDDFYDHQCKESAVAKSLISSDPIQLTPKNIKELAQKCNLCGVKCGHFRTCPKMAHKFQQTTQPASFTAGSNTSNNSSNINVEKYYAPLSTNVQKDWAANNVNQEILKQALSTSNTEKDYYEVGSAASFCHVDIANDSDNRSSPEKTGVDKLNLDCKTNPKYDSHKNPLRCQDTIENNAEETHKEQQTISSKSLPNSYDNVFVNSVSDESDNSENRLNPSDTEKEDSPIQNHNSDDPSKLEEDKVSTDADEDVASIHVEESLERRNDKISDENNSEIGTNKKIEGDKVTEESESKEISDCFVKLKRLNENVVSSCNNDEEEEEKDDDKNDCTNSSNASSSSSSSSSTRDSTDIDQHEDDKDAFTHNECIADQEKTEDSDKIEDHVENLSVNEDEHVNNTLDESSLNNEENLSSLSNEESSNRFEDNKGKYDRNEEESEDSDKLSVNLCEDEEEKSNDEDSTSRNDNTLEKIDSSSDKMEADVTSDQIDENSLDPDVESKKSDAENDVAMEESQSTLPPKETTFQCDGISIQLASEEVMAMALTLEDKMDSLSSQSVIKECVRTSCTTCSYCSHAIKIAVNGKQLAVHLLTEHRYMPVKNETVEDIIERLKKSLDELKDVWFNTDSYDSSDKSCFVPYDHTYECFQCNYVANTHKDLFSHKRKVHQKTILYCSMCKENFYSYSELLCHMCPGLYDASKEFRCCLCTADKIPSAFRLMVHLRKSHHTCDICLEIVDDQQKLSAHMVKHKLHHLCYRCGIAYRNKPDITKHLFWKHGTESVLCKKCLQKKWPHVYHFCIPPSSFICEECNLSFSKAVYLKVHKRFHNNNLPHTCNTCEQKFVAKKLLYKHVKTHEPIVTAEDSAKTTLNKSTDTEKHNEQNSIESSEPVSALPGESTVTQNAENSEKPDEVSVKQHKKKSKRDKEKKVKPVVDVYDLPPLNLSSESDDSDDEKESKPAVINNIDDKEREVAKADDDVKTADVLNESPKENVAVETKEKPLESNSIEPTNDNEENTPPITVVDGIWDNFHTYKAEQEKRENLDIANKQSILSQLEPAAPSVLPIDNALGDHDYCLPNNPDEKERREEETDGANKAKSNEHSSSIDHDYCTQKNSSHENNNANAGVNLLNTSNQSENTESPPKRKQKSPKKKVMKHHNNSSSSSDSSSDSDSSSCSCGTNCSCSSSSSNSSSSSSSDSDSSSSDGRHNGSNVSTSKREKRKERLKNKKKNEIAKPTEPVLPAEEPVANISAEVEEPLIKESDLETDETATDEEFYDQYPQMQANQILAEKRNQLMLLATVAPTVNNGTASPLVPNNNNISTNTNINLDPVSSPKLEIVAPPVVAAIQPQLQNRKKVKTKKRRKSSNLSSRNRSSSKSLNSSYDTPQPSTSFTTQWQPSSHGKKVTNDVSPMYIHTPLQSAVTPTSNARSADLSLLSTPTHDQHSHHTSASSESSSSKRFSKRRRVRNKFYGYSSDEDGEHNHAHPPTKWKKFSPVDGNVKQNIHHQTQQQFISQPVNAAPPEYNHTYQQQMSPAPPAPRAVQPIIRTTYNENQINNSLTNKRVVPTPISSNSSSESDEDSDSDSNRLAINHQMATPVINPVGVNVGASEKDDKLYCYCQCPYDEVSEMIACDGIDCAIEWFHFECVGIMVPPKGKWYCPDCRKRRGLS